MKTLAYAEVFHCPMTAPEVHRYLVGVEASPEAVQSLLANREALNGSILEEAGWYALRGGEHLFALRRVRSAPVSRLWRQARFFGHLLALLPFVRMIAVTGSLAVDNAGEDDDIDFLIVARDRRVWLCRGLALFVVRLAAVLGVRLCPNYVTSERALPISEHSLFSAHELAQAVPLYGIMVYRAMRRLNAWTGDFLPNASGALYPDRCRDLGSLGRLTKRLGERLLGGRLGDRLESWECTRKTERLSRHGGEGVGGVILSSEMCKGHFAHHGARTMAQYERRLADLSLVEAVERAASGPQVSLSAPPAPWKMPHHRRTDKDCRP